MDVPPVHYVDADDGLRIAYQAFGDGPPCVVAFAAQSSIEASWEPNVRRVWDRMAANLRVVMFDHRGSGSSDGFDEPPTLSERALDIKAVMDAAGVERATVAGFEFGAQVAVAFAAEYPSRTDRVILYNGRVGRPARAMADELAPGAPEPLPQFVSKDNLEALDLVGVEVDVETVTYLNPSIVNFPGILDQMLRYQRSVGSRRAHRRQVESLTDIEIVSVAPDVRAPTLIVHSVGNRMHHVGYARYLAQLIPDATLLELPGDDQMYWLSDNWKDYVDAGIAFVVGTEVKAPLERVLAVVMFTDIVGSTARSVEEGDSRWRAKLDAHDRISSRVVAQHGGSLIKNTGDGILATFDMPSDALGAAQELRRVLREVGIDIRTGLHAGEIEARGDDISGATVNIAARVQQAAADGEIYTTTAIREMLVGSPHQFDDAGIHPLKGFEETWPLHRVTDD